jgi:uncharacterized Zn finger protein
VNRWDGFEWRRATKQPAPEHGIKVKKAGTTWWGERWLRALEGVLRGEAGRLGRGKSYARAGRVHDLVIENGRVTARVTGTRPTPYEVRIELCPLDAEAWTRTLTALARKAQFSAELLAGGMPDAIDQVFHGEGFSLFPRQRSELVTSCSCPDAGNPCKHVAATHYVLGEALDRDPFLLFELRGKTKAQVLAELRAARGRAETSPAKSRAKRASSAPPTPAPGAEIPHVRLGRVAAETYDRSALGIPSLHFSFEAPVSHGATLRQLGLPAAWQGESLEASLGPLVRAAADTARRAALDEPTRDDTSPTAKPTAASKARKRKQSPRRRRGRGSTSR